MRRLTTSSGLFLLLVNATFAPAVEFSRQTITVSSDSGWRMVSHLQDIDNDGLTDLLVMGLAQRELRVYRQRKSGFADTPDQTVALRRDAAWSGLHDVDPHPGNELLLSAPTGIVYFRQNQGVFESSPQTLVEAQQVFTTESPRLMANLSDWGDANSVVPITFVDRTVLYQRDSSGTWRPGRTFDLEAKWSTWRTYQSSDWAIESNPSRRMTVRTMFRADPESSRAQENQSRGDEAWKLIEQIEKDTQWSFQRLQHQDIDGDGREDLILWRSRGDVNPKTIALIFVRGRSGLLPKKPTHTVRGSGMPILVNRQRGVSPMWDLDGDGRCELILVALKTRLTSWSGLVDMFLSGGIDWVFTVRSGRNGDYSGGPDFRMDVTSGMPRDDSIASLFQIKGDFNGDGREDLLVERSPDQFDVYLSSEASGFFRQGPAVVFRAPTAARRVDTADLNGDGVSDLFVQGREQPQVTVFLSQSGQSKGARR
jgi:hypothetical protein